MARLLLLALLVAGAWFSAPAHAATPPPLPLPDCVNGVGACPATNPLVTGVSSGTLTAGGSVVITTTPRDGVCNHMDGYTYIWSPSGCFAGVSRPTIVSCGYIDLKDMRWKESNCQNALYKVPSQAPQPLFTLMRPAGNTDYGGSTACGAAGDYQTYLYGGPANVPEAVWAARGDRAKDCELTMGAKRPDGLYGPTWVKVRVGIVYGEDGLGRSGRGESAEFFLPVDGDLRGGVDVDVLATHELGGSGENRTLKVQLVIENKGEVAADQVSFSHTFPDAVHVLSVSDSSCTLPSPFAGGSLQCNFSLPASDDPLGRNVKFIDIDTRIINATELEEQLTFKVTAANDVDTTNNEDSIRPVLNLGSGSVAGTLQLMAALDPYFNYQTAAALLDKQCDVYMHDIYARLNSIRDLHPEVFANLSFGRITSGTYHLPVIGWEAGHVGVVVYQKGTDYRETGVIVHGTPTWSPSDRDDQSIMGTRPMGDHRTINVFREGTADHGLYYRTPLANFPGNPKPESPLGCGFEGAYADNAGEFSRPPPGMCLAKSNQERDPAAAAMSCPFYPDAVVVRTQSPVDLLITNPRGQRVQTTGGEITRQELDSRIFGFPEAHPDGTFGWVLVLPKDQYDIALTGTGNGPYTLTTRQFDTAGKRVDKVVEGEAVPGRVDTFVFDGTTRPIAPPADPGTGPGNGSGSGSGSGNGNGADTGKGGGGLVDPLLLLSLAGLLMLAARTRRTRLMAR